MNVDIITLPDFPEQVSFSTKPPRTTHVWVKTDPELLAARERWRAESPPPWHDPKWFDREPAPPPIRRPQSKADALIDKILDALDKNPSRELAKELRDLTKQLVSDIDYFERNDLDLGLILVIIKEKTDAINQALIDGGDQIGTLQVIQRRLDRLTRGILTRPKVNAGDQLPPQAEDDEGEEEEDGGIESQNEDEDEEEELGIVDGAYIQEETINGITYVKQERPDSESESSDSDDDY